MPTPEAHVEQENESFDQIVRRELKQDIDKRRKYADSLWYLVVFWLIGIAGFLLLDGFWTTFQKQPFLQDAVILALIGGTTITVLGLFTIVVTYLFLASQSSGNLFEIVTKSVISSTYSSEPPGAQNLGAGSPSDAPGASHPSVPRVGRP
jgi:hypothetical protein